MSAVSLPQQTKGNGSNDEKKCICHRMFTGGHHYASRLQSSRFTRINYRRNGSIGHRYAVLYRAAI